MRKRLSILICLIGFLFVGCAPLFEENNGSKQRTHTIVFDENGLIVEEDSK